MELLMGSLIGAVIGYITNWLAIKMLFRPHRKITIFNIKVPFTPGLIPKERTRIAKSVGESIGRHLLTKETIVKSLCSENMNDKLNSWVKNKIGSIVKSKATIESELIALLGDEYSNFKQNTNNNLYKLIMEYINGEDTKLGIAKYVNSLIMTEIMIRPQVMCESELYNTIKNKVLNAAIEYKDSEIFFVEIQKILKEKVDGLKSLDKNFDEFIPKLIINSVKVHIYGKRQDIALEIKNIIKEEKNKQKLRKIVGDTITTKLNPMIAMFMNADSTYEKVVIGINEFLDEDENHNDIALIINDIIDKLLKNSISSVISEYSEDVIDEGINPIIKLFTTEIVDENLIRTIVNNFEAKVVNYISIKELLEKAGIDYKHEIEKFIKCGIETIVESHSMKIKIQEIVAVLINKLLNLEMKSIFLGEEDKVSQTISKVVSQVYNNFIECKAADVIEVLDVAKIVEDKINEFDVAFAEKIILDIASKELNAITWLGALLGAIMGLLSPILGSL